MSGIMGVYYANRQPIDSSNLARMLDALSHRGREQASMWHEGSIGLAHCLLCTTPESQLEKLPYCDRTQGLSITADARIDNRQELIDWLKLEAPSPDCITDSQIILAAYQEWGQKCPQKLLGVFAFAIWDERQQQLFCARDFFGIKPFYYHHSERVFCFASEIKALLCVTEVPQQLNELRIAQYLISNLDDREITFYQDILRLPPAHSLTISARGKVTRRYGCLDSEYELKLGSPGEYAEAYQALFKQAVNRRLRSSGTVGSLLSGGLDSSSICCMARDLLEGSDRKLHTFSGIFPGLPEADRQYADERFYLERVLESGSFISHQVRGDTLSPLYQQEQIFAHTDEPYMGPNYYLNWALYEQAHQQEVRVLLDGIDGDTTVSHGFEFFADFARRGRWLKVIREARQYTRRMRSHGVSSSAAGMIWKLAVLPQLPDFSRIWQQLRGNDPWYDASLIKPDFARRLNLPQRVRQLEKSDVPNRTARQNHWQALNIGIHPYVLELADKGTSAMGIEPRYPFFDRQLVEFCLSVPVEYKFHNGWTRYLPRVGMKGILPKAIQSRISKADVGRNFKRKLIEEEHQTLTRLLADPQRIAPYVDIPKLKASYQKCLSHQGSDDDIFCLYTTVNLFLWLKRLD
ncbi:MAG: lasso peptide isopeptide bond-forming cyclase [Cyanobacteria bacterium J06555_3]